MLTRSRRLGPDALRFPVPLAADSAAVDSLSSQRPNVALLLA